MTVNPQCVADLALSLRAGREKRLSANVSDKRSGPSVGAGRRRIGQRGRHVNALRAIDSDVSAAMTPQQTGAQKGKAGTNSTGSRTAASHTLKRLKRDRP